MSKLLDLFKKKYNLKYTITFDQQIPKTSDEEDGEVKYVDYVNAKDISSDIKVKGTKYYIAHSLISNNTAADFVKFTIFFRCRYDKRGKDYIREDLVTMVQKAFGIYSFKAEKEKKVECDIDLEKLLKDNVDYIFEDLDYPDDDYRILFSFKGFKDRDGKDIEGYVSFSSFDNLNFDAKFLDYLRKTVISKSVR